MPTDQQRLDFARWLRRTGRINDLDGPPPDRARPLDLETVRTGWKDAVAAIPGELYWLAAVMEAAYVAEVREPNTTIVLACVGLEGAANLNRYADLLATHIGRYFHRRVAITVQAVVLQAA